MRTPMMPLQTSDLNKKQQNKAKAAQFSALQWLAQSFPNAFNNKIMIRPLKIGIMKDVLAQSTIANKSGISKTKLRQAVALFTRRIDYLSALKARDMRIDLYGNTVGTVSNKEATEAHKKITRGIEQKTRISHQDRRNSIDFDGRKNELVEHSKPLINENMNTYYSDKAPSFKTETSCHSQKTPTLVTVKHKASRRFDPKAIARLKDKLNITQNAIKE